MAEPNLCRDASARLYVSVHPATSSEFSILCQELARLFALCPDGELVTDSASVIFRSYRHGAETVELAWDNWLGFTVTATTQGAEPVVEQIAKFLNER